MNEKSDKVKITMKITGQFSQVEERYGIMVMLKTINGKYELK